MPEEDHKVTGEGDRNTQPNYKPEDLLKLVMTAGEEKANLSPVNRTRQSSKQAQAGNPDECEHNPCMHAMHHGDGIAVYGYCYHVVEAAEI